MNDAELHIMDVPELNAILEDGLDGNLYAYVGDGVGWCFELQIRTDIADEARTGFIEWAEIAAAQLRSTNNPRENGWNPSKVHGPGVWYMTAREVWLPEI